MKSGKSIQEGFARFAASMQEGPVGRYKYAEISPPTMTGSAFMGMTLSLIGELDSLDPAAKSTWIKQLQSCQDEETGLFINPEFRSADRISAKHSDSLLHAHHSTFAMGLLAALGGKCLHPIRWVHPYREPAKMRKWIESLGWEQNAWVVGNWTYDMGCAMGMDHLITGDDAVLEGMDAYFDWFDEHQVDETGWWDLKPGGSALYEQQFGGYHTLMVYWMFDRPIARADKIIDSSLALQKEDGMFDPDGGGGCCQDMDCIDPLVAMGQATDYRHDDIAAALRRALPPILAKLTDDGGIYDSLAWERAEFGWQLAKAARGAADACSCWFYGFCIALMGEFLNDPQIMDTTWHHHQTYCHCVRRPAVLK